ncbi:MAG TPA: flagella basal body P-ring formation protein FlgA [Terriglobales bacterium]|nr:flagella basal body P-ring formation protein FlgA [Terriglobales bacterium]
MKEWHERTLLLMIGWLLLSSAAAQVVVLRQTAGVSSDTVRLSDLLPSTASAELVHRAQAIELGRAPQCGSTRLFEQAKLAEIVGARPELAGRVIVPDQVLITRFAYTLRSVAIHDAITHFLRQKGNADLSDAIFSWPKDITTMEANPELEVRSVNQDPSTKHLQFHFRCKKPQVCPDFIVSSELPASVIVQASQSPNRALAAARNTSVAQANALVLVKAGHRMPLLIQGDGIQISALVICLQNGRMGETIRVRQIGSAQVFRAQVMSRDLLWSKLES